MAIDISKYIDITSGVGGAGGVRQRDLILRIFTTNVALADGAVVEFTDLADVGTEFTTVSTEYKMASFYFGWVSKNIKSPKKISFAGYRSSDVITDILTSTTDTNNNFGSFVFAETLILDNVELAAAWADSQNVRYLYSEDVTSANATAWSAALIGLSGSALTLAQTNEYHKIMPCAILAATDYTLRSAVQSYMYQEFSATPTVTTTTLSNSYDALRVNYYGQTQTAGQNISFYQRGYMNGLATDPTDMGVFANEMWLKDAFSSALLSLLLSMPQVAANKIGRSQILGTLQSVISQALYNGVVSVGKALNNTQKEFITSITGDDKAWYKIQSVGYWVDCVIQDYVTVSGTTEYKAVYTLLYSKDGTVRSVVGSDILI